MNPDVIQSACTDIRNALDRIEVEIRPRSSTIFVTSSDDLQQAITDARPGDTLYLVPAVRYVTGKLRLPAKDGLVTIRSVAALPDRRLTLDDAPLLPILASGNNGPVIDGTGAKNWRLDGLQFEPTANGAGEVITLQDAVNVSLDRVLIVGGDNGQKRGIRGNGQQITLSRSHLANIWAFQQDSQAFCAWDGAGPYAITDNYLEAAGENVMFGGSDSAAPDRVPADILVEGNTFTKRLDWKGVANKYSVKNLFELKAAKRVIVRGNDFSRCWTDGQDGYAWSVKSVNQGGHAPWSCSEDVLFENNLLHDVEDGVKIQGFAADQPGGVTTRIVFRGNLIQTPGTAFQIGSKAGEITIERNTVENGYTFMQLNGQYAAAALTVLNNLANHNAYGVKGDGTGIGLPSLAKFVPSLVWKQNVLLGGKGKGSYPAETWFDLASVPATVVIGK